MANQKPLPVSFYRRNTLDVARDLLGKKLVIATSVGVRAGLIVETEAYRGIEDKACHGSWRKKTSCLNLWGDGGILYVYLTYGIHWMLNVVTEDDTLPSAVLIRALEPLSGIARPTNGPGRLTKALGINKTFDGKSLASDELFITFGIDGFTITQSARIGVGYAEEWSRKPWRFYISGNSYVSLVR